MRREHVEEAQAVQARGSAVRVRALHAPGHHHAGTQESCQVHARGSAPALSSVRLPGTKLICVHTYSCEFRSTKSALIRIVI